MLALSANKERVILVLKPNKIKLIVLLFSLGYLFTIVEFALILNIAETDTSNCPVIIERECYTKTDKGDFQLIVRTTCGNK